MENIVDYFNWPNSKDKIKVIYNGLGSGLIKIESDENHGPARAMSILIETDGEKNVVNISLNEGENYVVSCGNTQLTAYVLGIPPIAPKTKNGWIDDNSLKVFDENGVAINNTSYVNEDGIWIYDKNLKLYELR